MVIHYILKVHNINNESQGIPESAADIPEDPSCLLTWREDQVYSDARQAV